MLDVHLHIRIRTAQTDDGELKHARAAGKLALIPQSRLIYGGSKINGFCLEIVNHFVCCSSYCE